MSLLLSSPLGRYAIGIALVLVIIISAMAWLRSDAASTAILKTAVEAAQTQEEIRHEAEAEARNADRSGSLDRLRSGHF